jgi:hypothetical protein
MADLEGTAKPQGLLPIETLRTIYMNLYNYLSVFNQILSLGKKRDGRFYFDVFSAWHDVDGYTCYIGYKDLVMTIYFHSQFSFEYHEKATMKRFTKLVDGQQITFKKR